MKILLVGGNSTLAKVLLPILASFAEVLTAGRSGCDLDLDLAWPSERLELPAGLDAVIHLAANFGGQDFDAMLAAEDINVLGALKVAHACKQAGVGKMVLVSSIFSGLNEDSPFYNSYALSKRHAEELTRLYCRSTGLPLVILRPSQLFGEGDAFRRHQPFLYRLIDMAQRGEEIVIYGRNDAQRNFIHVLDVAQVLSRLVQQRIVGTFDCVSMTNVRFSEIAAAAVTAFGSDSMIRFDTSRPDILDNAFVGDDSLYQSINYFPEISFEEGMAREAAYRRGQP